MKNTTKEVALTVSFRGVQTSRGRYSYSSSKDENNNLVSGVTVLKAPTFSEQTQYIPLGTQFVQGALEEAPKHMKMPPHIWTKLPENKRIGIHVDKYVNDMFPNRKDYKYEII